MKFVAQTCVSTFDYHSDVLETNLSYFEHPTSEMATPYIQFRHVCFSGWAFGTGPGDAAAHVYLPGLSRSLGRMVLKALAGLTPEKRNRSPFLTVQAGNDARAYLR